MDVAPATKTYLALGDSYTIGEGVSEALRFPNLTVQMLRGQGVQIANPVYIATTGWTTQNLLNAINNNPPQAADIVTLLIGVNDQYQGVDTSVYRTRFVQLLKKAIFFAGGKTAHVFVLSIPDYSATLFVKEEDKDRISKEIALFNMINQEETAKKGVSYTNITPLTKDAAFDPSLLAPDGLHYSGKEHQKWAELLAPKIKAALL